MKFQGLQMHNLGRMGANSQNAILETLTLGFASYGFIPWLHVGITQHWLQVFHTKHPDSSLWMVNELVHDTTILSMLTYITFACE